MNSIDFMDSIDRVRFNPSAIQRVILNNLEEIYGGSVDIVDPTNPFVFLLEASTLTAAVGISQNETLIRRQYPSLAQTEDELYHHMADIDYLDRFSNPSRTTFTILLSLEEVKQRAVSTGLNGIRKLVIPRHSRFTVSDITFTMQYPIDIRIMGHGGVQIVYDVSRPSPIEVLETNLVDWRVVNISGTEFIRISVPVSQFEINTHYTQLIGSTGFSKTYAFNDQYYHCRVYQASANGQWVEIHTTHSDQVYDPTKPTAVLQVLDGELKVTIPQVYFSRGNISSELRVDIHTTRGPLELLLSQYSVNSFSAKWIDLEGDDDGVYTAPLAVFTTMAVFSDQAVTGGTDGISFEQLRERVINNSLGASNIPITHAQLESRLDRLGYQLVKDVDDITNRVFLATKTLPMPKDTYFHTPAGCFIATYQSSMDQLSQLPTAYPNGERITLSPKTLYELQGGQVVVIPNSEVEALKALKPDTLVNTLGRRRFIYTPFHYVFDATDETFASRAYYLDNPTVESKAFIEENGTAQLTIATGAYQLERTGSGYRLTITTRSGDNFKALKDEQIVPQLSFKPSNESDRAYCNGTLIGYSEGERVYQFDITTNHDLNANDEIYLTAFKMYNDSPRKLAAPLLCEMDIVYIVTGHQPEGLRRTSNDNILGYYIPPEDAIGVTRERFVFRLGWALSGLWSNGRSVVGSEGYRTYPVDVPWFYEETIYQRDPVTGAIDLIYNEDGTIEYTVLHNEGDPVMVNGEQAIKYRAGEIMLDHNQQPIVESPRGMLRQVDMLFIDGMFYFATEDSAVRYRESIPARISSWVNEDIKRIRKLLFEQTLMYFYPRDTYGDITVIVQEGMETILPSEQSFSVDFYLTRSGYANDELRRDLTKLAVETISEVLQKTTITVTEMVSKLKDRSGDEVLSVEVRGMGGEADLNTVTVKESAARMTIRKKLFAAADESISVQEDVNVNFIRHLNE